MSETIKNAFDHVKLMERLRAILKEKSEYWPEVLESITEKDERGFVAVYLSTLQRYKHEGKWYIRHHLERQECKEEDVERYLNAGYRRLITQIHLSAQVVAHFDQDDEDKCQLDEIDRLKNKFSWLKRNDDE